VLTENWLQTLKINPSKSQNLRDEYFLALKFLLSSWYVLHHHL
jgi:hypothetical protein